MTCSAGGVRNVRGVVAAERGERLHAADELAAHGREAPAAQLRHEAALLARYLGGDPGR